MSVTEQDRARAVELLRSIAVGAESTTVGIVAAAIAEERDRARAQFRALLDVSPQLTNEDGTLRGYLVSLPLLSTIGLEEA